MDTNPLLPHLPDLIFGYFGFVLLIGFALFIWTIVDIWRSNATEERKILWTILALVANFIGMVLWFAVGRKTNK
jgi:hypothetical protein